MDLKAQTYKKRRKTIKMVEKYTTVNLHGLVSLQTLFSLFGLSGFLDISGKVWPTEHNTE